jgi:hypothetical protein
MRKVLLTTAVVSAVCILGTAQGSSWYVDRSVTSPGNGTSWDSAFRAIQQGIEKASHGDVVTVAQGIYVENIHFVGKNILVRSTNPNDPAVVAATIIDGDEADSVVTFNGTENASCILTGFTIRNGKGGAGGGVRGNDSLATIQFNLIGLNEATTVGGGLYGCNGLITGNIITQNSAAGSGGGLSDCDGKVVNNVITQNAADDGGGLAHCLGETRNNSIRHNSAIYAGGGLFSCYGLIQNNVISGNSARYGGGMDSCDSIVNDTIVNNSATISGGGLRQSVSEAGTANCIIWGNETPDDPQVSLGGTATNPTYSCIQDWTGGGTGNFALEPDFVDSNGSDGDPSTTWDNNYRLSSSSACIDRGNNDAYEFPRLDKDGNLRITYGNRSLTVDMGAFEYNSMRFTITEIAPLDATSVSLTWTSQPNNSYVLWFLQDASAGAWVNVDTIASQGATTSSDVSLGSSFTGFWIVEMAE